MNMKINSKVSSGRAIVRLLPSTAVPEFTNFQPRTTEEKDNNDKQVLTIHVQFQPKNADNDTENGDDNKLVEFQMNRDANEPSHLALRRLEVTARKKLMKLCRGEHTKQLHPKIK
eukprot:CAMPEP_0196823594 /NCGR_PEP_ID=MMETSP1362-20130617/88121_1 /TAXON_ID=163516 /ORGANISM="Leptocylindrus danicus, Strain CCMP1856" /LENGTH=114 /DNA_ID=CAMNT_0042203511 /DNA_START=17 /DNA_END=358 /DNA_ORIENTATION=+